MTSFQAYDRTVHLIQQLLQRNFLVTVGADEDPLSSIIRIWNLDKDDKGGIPLCVKSIPLNLKHPYPVCHHRLCTGGILILILSLIQILGNLCNSARGPFSIGRGLVRWQCNFSI